jgi:hypothetical protein
MGMACSTLVVRNRNECRILVGKPKGKRPRNNCRKEDRIKMDLREVRWDGVNWIQLA